MTIVHHYTDSPLARFDGVDRSIQLTISLASTASISHVVFRPASSFIANRSDEIPSLWLPFRDFRVPLPCLGSTKQRAGANLVHVHSLGPIGIAGLERARRDNIPLVISWHTDYEAYAAFYREIRIVVATVSVILRLKGLAPPVGGPIAMLLNLADVVVAPTVKAKNQLDRMGVTVPVTVLPTPAALPSVDSANVTSLKASFGIPTHERVILAVGRLAAEKNWELLVCALPAVLLARPSSVLLLVGDGRRMRRLKDLCAQLGISNSVIFAGFLAPRELASVMSWADVMAFTSTTDTQGLVMDEAEIMDIPVVMVDSELSTAGISRRSRICTAPETLALSQALIKVLEAPARESIGTPIGTEQGLHAKRFYMKLSEVYRSAVRRHRDLAPLEP